MDALLTIPREATPAVVFLRSEIPADHPSSAILGEERLGAGVAVAGDRILTAHYLVMGARRIEVTGFDGRERAVRRTAVDHTTGLALSRWTAPRCGPRASATDHEPRPGTADLPPDLHPRRRAQGDHRARLGGRPVRGLLGVHARPRHHDHRHQPRPGRGAALRPRGPPPRPRLPGPGRRRPLQPGHPRAACTSIGARRWRRKAGPAPAGPGWASFRRPSTAA